MTPTTTKLRDVEPAALAEALRLVLVALVALGWITLDEEAIAAVVSAVAGALSIGLTIWTRRKVTPIK
jgi:hypothetical protein